MSGTRTSDVPALDERPDRSVAVVTFGRLAEELEGLDEAAMCRVIARDPDGGRPFLGPNAHRAGPDTTDPTAVMAAVEPAPAVVFVATPLGTASGEPLDVLRALADREALGVAVVSLPDDDEPAGKDPRSVVDRVQSAAAATVVVPADVRTSAIHDVVSGIGTVMNDHGLINLDLADVRAVLSRGPQTVVTTGRSPPDAESPGDPAAVAAVADALERIPGDAHNATGALLQLRVEAQTSVDEAVAAAEGLRPMLSADDPLIWGVSVDPYRTTVTANLVLSYAERPWLEEAIASAGRLEAGGSCPRCGGHVASYQFGDRERLACDGCGFAGVDVRLG